MGKSKAFDRGPGSHEKLEGFTYWYKHYYKGDLVVYAPGGANLVTASCNRTRGGSPKTTILGTDTPWRDSSLYEQSVLTVNRQSGLWQNTMATDHVEEIWSPYSGEVVTDCQNPYAFDCRIPTVVWSDNLANQALTQAILKVKDMKAGIGEDLATAKQTYSMIVDNGKKLLEAALALKRGNLGRVWGILGDNRSALKVGANFFLQYKYGWKPLMSDIYGLTGLMKQQLKPALLFSAHSTAREDFSCLNTWGSENSGGGYRSCRAKLYGKLNNTSSHMWDQLGLSNPLALAWELVPYSFVVDWFIPVGDVLEAMQPPLGVDFVGGSLTTIGSLDATTKQSASLPYVELSPRLNTYSGWSMRRHPITGTAWPSPGFYAKSPFSSGHGQSAIALLLQRLRGR